ncbi:MAG: hypothetical protein DRI70_02330 [Bacteroidetes bacterium]|nr:MAG: hypothetical protein DRI70_02330 [Bacteroidota bacterium]
MKISTIIIMLPLLLLQFNLSAQTKADSIAIKKACRDYVEGWLTGDLDRIAQGVSPELIKRTIGRDKEGSSFTSNMSASLLKISAKGNKGGTKMKDLEPDKEFKLDVYIYDITGNYALVNAVNTKYGFFDYCQLAKFNNEWKIFNVMWDDLPVEK